MRNSGGGVGTAIKYDGQSQHQLLYFCCLYMWGLLMQQLKIMGIWSENGILAATDAFTELQTIILVAPCFVFFIFKPACTQFNCVTCYTQIDNNLYMRITDPHTMSCAQCTHHHMYMNTHIYNACMHKYSIFYNTHTHTHTQTCTYTLQHLV